MKNPSEDTAAPWKALPSWLLTQTADHAHHLVSEGFNAVEARGYHYRLLATLEGLGPSSQATLSRQSGIHVSDMVATINELAERGYVERTPDMTDRRRNVISLTPSGKRHLHRLEKRLSKTQDELLAPLTVDERKELTELLSRLLSYHNSVTGNPENDWQDP